MKWRELVYLFKLIKSAGQRRPGLDDFDSLVLNGRVNLGFTNTIGLRLFTGYNLLGDVLQLQSRFRWRYAPGSDLFVVQQVNLNDDTWTPVLASVIAKASYRWEP